MAFAANEQHREIEEAIGRICQDFEDDYWLARDTDGVFPHAFYQAIADGGWLGIAMPVEHGGAGLGITEAAVMMRAIAESGAGMSGASAVHMNIFGLQPVVVFGTEEQKRRMLPPLIRGEEKACFAVTEPDVGLNTIRIKTRAVRDGDRYIISGQKIWISTAQVAHKMLILARTGDAERQGQKGLSLFYTDLDRSRIEVRAIHKHGRHAVDSNCCSLTARGPRPISSGSRAKVPANPAGRTRSAPDARRRSGATRRCVGRRTRASGSSSTGPWPEPGHPAPARALLDDLEAAW